MRVEGSVLQPSGEMSLTADAVRLSGRDAGEVVARAHAAQGQIRLALRAPRFGAEASGDVTLESPRPWTADVTLNGADVVQALTLLGVNPETLAASTAALSASGRASGNLDTRSLSTATMEVRALDGQVRGQPLSLVQPARLRLDEGLLSVEPLQLRLGGLSVRAAGSWGAAPGTPAEGIAVNLDGRVEDVLNYLPPTSRDRLRVEGPLKVDLNVRGSADLASISGDAFAQVTYLEEKGPARAGSRPPRARSLSGEVRLALDLRATAFEPSAVDGTIVATTLAISAGQFPIAQQAPTRLRLEKGRILIEQFDWTLPSGGVAASGTIGLGPANHGDMRVSGAMPLGLVDVFLPGRGGGRAAFDIRIAGPINSLQYEGAIELTDARLILPEGRVSLAGWTGRLEVTGETDRSQGASRPGQWWRRLAQRDGHSTRNPAGSTADHQREERVSRDPPRAEKRAQCRPDLAQSERASSPVGFGHDHCRSVHGTRDRHGPHRVGVDTSVGRHAAERCRSGWAPRRSTSRSNPTVH